VPLDPALLAALKRERSGSATFTLVDGVKVRLPFSLLGFSAALRAGERAVSRAP
jgi:invasion protein IalB